MITSGDDVIGSMVKRMFFFSVGVGRMKGRGPMMSGLLRISCRFKEKLRVLPLDLKKSGVMIFFFSLTSG